MEGQEKATGTVSTESDFISPFGGNLRLSSVRQEDTETVLRRMATLPRIHIDEYEFRDLDLLAHGLYSPLDGCLDQDNYLSVLEALQLSSGLPWAWPVTVSASDDEYLDISRGGDIALYLLERPIAILSVESVFRWNPDMECQRLFPRQLSEPAPVRSRRERAKKHLISGPVQVLSGSSELVEGLRHPGPSAARSWFARQRWHRISAVSGIHLWRRSHEHLLRNALETSDAVIAFPDYPGAKSKALPYAEQLAVEQQVIRDYFPQERVWLNTLSRHVLCTPERALLQQAIVSQNYGCDRLYVAPDGGHGHEWVSVIDRARKSGLAIHVQPLGDVYHCEACGGHVSENSCPHGQDARTRKSGTTLLEMLRGGNILSPDVVRPEIARALARAAAPSDGSGGNAPPGRYIYPHASAVSRELRQALAGHGSAVLWLTGLSGSGKSTIAARLERELVLSGHRAYVLDGDTLRHGLCSDLDFSRKAREENIRRAAEVAKIMSDAATIVIASFISPFRAEREQLTKILGEAFIEVYVEASLETCETRDPKGLYRRARAGLIPEFTGVSSPYEAPLAPKLHVNTDEQSVEECVQVLLAGMDRQGLLRSSANLRPTRGRAADIRVSDQRFQ